MIEQITWFEGIDDTPIPEIPTPDIEPPDTLLWMYEDKPDIKIIYCRGGDKFAPILAEASGMLYGVRYDYTAYSKDIYMVDAGLSPVWTTYLKKLRRYKPTFALTPDYEKYDPVSLELRVLDVKNQDINLVGVCPKFTGAVYDIPTDCIICESIPTEYAGWIIPDNEILENRDYHLLGGDPVYQKREIDRITSLGGRVVSVDGNKIAMKASHGQVFDDGKWIKMSAPTNTIAMVSAKNLVEYLR